MDDKILVTGYAKIPGGIAGSDIYSVLGLGLEIELETGKIVEADTNLIIEIAKKYVKNILIGEKITELDRLEYKFKTQYHGSARKAIIVALKICYDRYFKAKANIKNLKDNYENNSSD